MVQARSQCSGLEKYTVFCNDAHEPNEEVMEITILNGSYGLAEI